MLKKVLIALGLVAAAGFAGLVVMVRTATAPYAIAPISVTPTPDDTPIGHAIDDNTRILSVFSPAPVVVVADPGVSFQYEVLWLVTVPQPGRASQMKEYRFELPEHAAADKVNALDAQIPPEIVAVASRNDWK